jgi:hypothetical protein
MAEGLKAMALEGHRRGLSALQRGRRGPGGQRELVAAAPAGLRGLQITMDVRALNRRKRRPPKDSGKGRPRDSRGAGQAPCAGAVGLPAGAGRLKPRPG